MDFVGNFAGMGGLNEASGDPSEHGSIEIGVCCKGGGDSVGGQRDNWGQKGTIGLGKDVGDNWDNLCGFQDLEAEWWVGPKS